MYTVYRPVHNILHVSCIYRKSASYSQEVDFLEIQPTELFLSRPAIYVGYGFYTFAPGKLFMLLEAITKYIRLLVSAVHL